MGYFLNKGAYEPAPLVLAFILGPIIENFLRQTLNCIERGFFCIYITTYFRREFGFCGIDLPGFDHMEKAQNRIALRRCRLRRFIICVHSRRRGGSTNRQLAGQSWLHGGAT